MAKNYHVPGATVRLTGTFLRNTGQIVGGEGHLTWQIVACDCGMCRGGHHVAVNEPHRCQEDPRGYEDIPPAQRPKWRHIAKSNLEVQGAPLKARDYP